MHEEVEEEMIAGPNQTYKSGLTASALTDRIDEQF